MNPFLGEIRCFGFTFAPRGYMQCNGQLLGISSYSALYSVLGTTYGGDGQTTFGLPNLQGQVPMHWGTSGGLNTSIGEVQGTAGVTLIPSQIPLHNHTAISDQAAKDSVGEKTAIPNANTFLSGVPAPDSIYESPPTTITAQFSPKAISITGGSLPHENMQPYLVLNFCIAVDGIFPSRN